MLPLYPDYLLLFSSPAITINGICVECYDACTVWLCRHPDLHVCPQVFLLSHVLSRVFMCGREVGRASRSFLPLTRTSGSTICQLRTYGKNFLPLGLPGGPCDCDKGHDGTDNEALTRDESVMSNHQNTSTYT
jgi:hypothetical protein